MITSTRFDLHAFATVGATFAVSLVATLLVHRIAVARRLLDAPNERSAHAVPTPRLGGLAVMVAFLPSAAWVLTIRGAGAGGAVILAATAAISLTGLVDDLKPLPARWRLGIQALAAVAVVGANLESVPVAWTLLRLPGWILVLVSVLWIVWVTNLYNFMDGIDGLAGGQAVIAACAIAVASNGAASVHGALAIVLGGSVAGFLVLNFPPAKIFLGDVGSTAIGFFFAAVPFLPGRPSISVEVVGIALALFVLDATWTLGRRIARGERVYEAHRTHWYQRPLACGVPHRPITLVAYGAMVLAGILAVAYGSIDTSGRFAVIAAVVALFAAIMVLVLAVERRSRADRARSVARG